MKNKIKQFAKGDFKQKQPDIRFSETQLIITVSEGDIYEGSFVIENTRDGAIRGLVYPSSFRVHCLEEGFEGNPIRINYTFDCTGLMPGHVEQGKFTVVCNGGEYELPFTVFVEHPFVMTDYGKVQSMTDFKRLAMQDFAEAKRLFRTRKFYDVLKYEDNRVRNLYDNMRKWSLDEQALEEFLVGIKQKERIFLTAKQEEICHDNILETQKGRLDIIKNTWGFASISLETVGDFLEIRKRELTTEDFVGNVYSSEYMIHVEKLHSGYNFGAIFIHTPYETIQVKVTVHQSRVQDEMRGMKGIIAGKGLKQYLAFISGKIGVNEWVEQAIKRINQLCELEPANEHYELLKAHVYLRGRWEEEAKWVLDNSSCAHFAIGRKPEISAYYLFLTALLKKDIVHTNRVLEEINRMYMKHLYSWPLLCMIINLDPKYKDYSNRIRVLERQFFNGANQILLYAEAYICFQEKVLLLRKLESFEIQVLNFATKYNIITRELALQMADLVCQQRKYDPKLVRILERAYEMFEEPRILQAICMQLIKGNKVGNTYFKWYEKAASREMKIAQLYEYYLMSVHEKRVNRAFPRTVFFYFMHGINLDYKSEAFLYENIILYEDLEGEIYKHYNEQMKTFAYKQLLKRRINDSLRVIYNRFINPNTISLDELDALYDVCHTYQVTTKNKGMKYVLVIEKDGSVKQRIPYKSKEGAQICLYDKEARIVWEADNGMIYTDSVSYEIRRLFHELRFIELCKNKRIIEKEVETKEQVKTVTLENLQKYGMDDFDKQEIFVLCSRHVREQESIADDFLLYLCFELLKEEYYDKAILQYLAQFYCGATSDMKLVWQKAREYGVQTKSLAERIITQMLFAENVFREEEIFEDYYAGRPYFRLKQAYLAYIARAYVTKNRIISEYIIKVMLQEMMQGEELADICKVAVLKYYAGQELESALENIIREYFITMCEKHMVFDFYVLYPQRWLREVQLYDKVLVSYPGNIDGKVKLYYRIEKQGVFADEYHSESLLPTYDNIYMREFVLYEGETLNYYFEETNDEEQFISEKKTCIKDVIVYEDGKYGRLNLISRLSREKQYIAMLDFRKEEQVAKEVFKTY